MQAVRAQESPRRAAVRSPGRHMERLTGARQFTASASLHGPPEWLRAQILRAQRLDIDQEALKGTMETEVSFEVSKSTSKRLPMWAAIRETQERQYQAGPRVHSYHHGKAPRGGPWNQQTVGIIPQPLPWAQVSAGSAAAAAPQSPSPPLPTRCPRRRQKRVRRGSESGGLPARPAPG